MICTTIRDKIFKNGPSKICGRQPLKNLKEDYLKIHKIFGKNMKTFFLIQ